MLCGGCVVNSILDSIRLYILTVAAVFTFSVGLVPARERVEVQLTVWLHRFSSKLLHILLSAGHELV